MRFLSGFVTGIVVAALFGAVGAASWWIVTAKGPEIKHDKPEPPAKVAKAVKEDELNTITLKPEAEKRIDVQTKAVEHKSIRRTREYGGEVTVPVGRSIVVSAPLGGILKAPPDGVPQPGKSVTRGQPIFTLLPLLTPEARTTLAAARVDAEGQVENARTQVNAAQVTLDRAKNVLSRGAGRQRDVDDAQAQYDLAHKTLQAAQARRNLLVRAVGEVEKGTAAPLTIEAPQDGVLRNLLARPEQNVPSGAALFEVVDLDKLWVRVPVYVGDRAEIDPEAGASFTVRAGEPAVHARPVTAPPSANPLAATVDLYYEVDNASVHLIPGERVFPRLPLRGEAESTVVPWSAVVHDIYGGTWVYEQTAPRTYVRRPVTVRYVMEDQAVLGGVSPADAVRAWWWRAPDSKTPPPQVVVRGAQELFGTETGFSK
jgi:multidrug efflux pump subunit AcrA (membrane-fusion protein)